MDMAEFLWNNNDAERRRAKDSGAQQGSQSMREDPDLLSWIHVLGFYPCVVASALLKKIRQLWGFQAMLVEVRRCGGTVAISMFARKWPMIKAVISQS